MSTKLKKIILAMGLLISISRLYAQNCPDNIDFEKGTLNTWNFYTGTCCPISTPSLSGPVAGRHTLTSGVSLDRWGGFPTVAPGGGNFSLRLGNDTVGKQAERARYYIRVPAGSGRYILVYRYAVVLQNPNHNSADQPRFEVRAYDSLTNMPLTCNQFSYVASSSLPGFIQAQPANQGVYYKPWTTGTLDLTGFRGQTIAVDFATGDCSLGGHFGYGYVDMSCGLFQIYAVVCNSSSKITLKAPAGFAKYKWMNSTFTTTYDTLQNTSIPAPSSPQTYAVILTPYPGYGCTDTLYTTYVVATTTANAGRDTTICLGQTLTLTGTASTTDTPLSYLWGPIPGLSCFNCQTTTFTPSKSGNYYFTASSKAGCDYTDTIKVTVDTVVFASLGVSNDSLCLPDTINLLNTYKKNGVNATYNWNIADTAIYMHSSKDSIRLTWKNYGYKKIKLTVTSGVCSSADSIVVGAGPPIYGTPLRDTTICYGRSVNLQTNTTSVIPISYRWTPYDWLTGSGANPTVTPLTTVKYILAAFNSMGCIYRDTVKITIDTVVAIKLLKNRDTICPGQKVTVWNTYKKNSPVANYSWFFDTAFNILHSRDSAEVSWGKNGLKKVKLTVSEAGCEVSDSVSVFVKSNNYLFTTPNMTKCIDDSLKLGVNVIGFNGVPMFQWTPADHLSCTNCQRPVTYSKYSIKYSVRLLNEGACADDADINVIVDSLKASIIASGPICENDSITLSNFILDSSSVAYTWKVDSGKVLNTHKSGTAKILFPKPGQNRVILNVKSWGCNTYDTAYITVNKKPLATLSMPDKGCTNEATILVAGKGNIRYYWTIEEQTIRDSIYNQLNLIWTAIGSKRISLTVKDSLGCISNPLDTAIMINASPYKPYITADISNKICVDDVVNMSTPYIYGYDYQWEPAGYIENSKSPRVTMRVPKDAQVIVKVTNEWNCSATDQLNLYTGACCEVFMPDAFTPNNDGRNDSYRPIGIKNQKIEVFMILNRWGQTVYSSTNAGHGWDGTFKGQLQDAGTYVYFLKYVCEQKTIEQKGSFLLLR